ncbi:MAG: hypothetical protein WD205_03690, partial [Rhodothermales bacterium]
MVGAEESPGSPRLVTAVRAASAVLGEYDANAVDLRISDILKECGIHPATKVYVNWDRFEEVDRMALDDLDDFFHYIWYPSSDDIDVFDDDLEWILSVTHGGSVMILTRGNQA